MNFRQLLLPTSSLLALALALPGAAAAANTADPGSNRELSSATLNACQSAPNSAECTTAALADIDAARASEGIKPMVLPSGYGSLTVPQQLMVLANLERADRGMKVLVVGLAADLNRNALQGANTNSDPDANPWNGDSMSSNWAGGYSSPLEADFSWMYDDGVGSPNLDCSRQNTSGCWGHRHDILMNFSAPLMMGAAATTGQYGVSLAEVFVGGDTAAGPRGADAPLAPTWADIAGSSPSVAGRVPSAPSVVAPAPTAVAASVSQPAASSTASAPAQPAQRRDDRGGRWHPRHDLRAGAAAAGCVVPNLRGLSLRRALAVLRSDHCAVGMLRFFRPRAGQVHRWRVVRQSVAPGSHRRAGFRISLRLRRAA